MFKKSIAAAGLAAAFMFIPTAANALDCTNLSRPAYTGDDWDYVAEIQSNVHFNGNWGYVEAWQAWVFVPPGNFQSGEGHALLVNAHCDSEGAVTEKRQSERGIQLMHGCG